MTEPDTIRRFIACARVILREPHADTTTLLADILDVIAAARIRADDEGHQRVLPMLRERRDQPTGLANDWWTISDVANYLGIGRGTVSTYHARGQMPPCDHRIGNHPVWRPHTITTWRARRPGRGNWKHNRPTEQQP